MSKTIHEICAERLIAITKDSRINTGPILDIALRTLLKWRSILIDNTIIHELGLVIQAGPFCGMEFVRVSSEANISPRILGVYEADLHPVIEAIIGSDIRTIVDIGCADGYYACGFAYRMPNVRVHGYDINARAQEACKSLAIKNGLSDRVDIHGEFFGADFEKLQPGTLIFLDAEGAEDDLLQPEAYAALKTFPILVECHDLYKPGLSDRIESRFSATHSIQRIEPGLHVTKLPSSFANASHLDQLLTVWEWRAGPTPWLFMTPK